MSTAADHACEIESAYLAGVQANLKAAGSRFVRGTIFKHEEHDRGENVRAAMIERRIYDKSRYAKMPQGRGFTVRGYERRFIFGRRLRSVTAATVIAPPEPLLSSDEPPPPVTIGQLNEHVRNLVVDHRTPHVIGVCSPSGFDPSVWDSLPESPNVSLVLISPREGGGWKTTGIGRQLDERLLALFDPEDGRQKIERVRREIRERSTDLLTGGLSAGGLAARLQLPPKVVQTAFEVESRADPELRLAKRSGDFLLYRGAPALVGEEDTMSLAQWIKSLFFSAGEEGRKIDVLAERRASLADRLNRMYEDIGKLEKKESVLIDEGKAATSNVVKRRVASQISHLRKDISRCNTSAAMLSKQINIISTHIHNLELAQTGSVAQLPSGDELTEAAVNAEEILEQLAASDELVSGMEVGMAQSAISSDEAAILKELEAPVAEKSPEGAPSEAAPTQVAEAKSKSRQQRDKAQAE